MQKYFKEIEDKVKVAYSVAEAAREKGLDPKSKVEIPLAKSLAERVVGLISSVYPQINDTKIVKRILELEKEYGRLDPAVSLKIAEEIAKQKFCKFQNLKECIDAGIRVAFAYLTLGVVAAPLEGYTHFKLKKTRDGKDYIAAYFSGPIGGAGRTAASISLLIIDYLRETFGYAKYDPTDDEVNRCVTELYDFHDRITNLQYKPTEKEIQFLAKNIPIQLDGEPSHDKEVSNYRDLERVETNFIRSGFCLILGEGISQKAPKALKTLKKLRSQGFKLSDWDFLEEFCILQKKLRDVQKSEEAAAVYIQDLVAGRPVFGHPSRSGGFRFRYGRSRVAGFSAVSVHPATMAITDGFIAIGTQLKIEKPTKGCVVSVCDSIDGPIVKLYNGSVKKLDDKEEAKKVYPDVEEILYLGDMLFPLGDVINRNHDLLKPGYVEEWWKLELEEKGFNEKIDFFNVSFDKAVEFSEKYIVPLYPKFIYYWTQISKEEFLELLNWLNYARIDKKIILPFNKPQQEKFRLGKRALELLGVEHNMTIENVVLSKENSKALLLNFGRDFSLIDKEEVCSFDLFDLEKIKKELDEKNVLDVINSISKFQIKDKAGDFIGTRMGRPEKAKLRKLIGSPHALFPVGREGGRLRSMQAAYEIGKIKSQFPIYYCENCKKETIYFICEDCNNECKKMNYCIDCHRKFFSEVCPEHVKAQSYSNQSLDVKHYFDKAVEKLELTREEIPPLIKGVRGTSSGEHLIEHLSKGILRALFDLHVNKDGTIRYDATEMPITHFKPKEISVGIEKLKEMGYAKDICGKELINEEQILELKPHDIILPCCPESGEERADDVFLKIANFIDLLLVKFYKLKPFYNVREKQDLVGHLIVCIAPHNCAGVVARIIGFSSTQGLLATPYMHAAMRRDCLDYDNYISIKRNGKWEIDKIGKIIEDEKPCEKADNFNTLKKKVKIRTYGNPGECDVIEITKHSPRKIYKICMEDGRSISLTETHRLYLKNKKEKRVNELEIGDKLIVNYNRNIEENNIDELFLPEIFRGREDIMIHNIKDFLGNFEKLSKHNNFWQRDSFPITFVENFFKKHKRTLKDLPLDAKISVKRDNIILPIRISLDNALLEAMGLYIAEGFSRKNETKKGFYQVSISGDKSILDFVKKVFFSHFNLEPSEEHMDHVTFSSRIIYELFACYLKMGSRAREKRIPSLFLNLKKEKIAALLRGYFEGDGSVSLSDIRVCCDTVSEGLKNDLSFVLSRFGIFTKFYEYEKEPGPRVREFYIKKNKKIPKFKITKILILSDFVKKFKSIGFLFERKNKILNELCKKSPYGMKIDYDDNYAYPKIVRIEELGIKESYCFNVLNEHNFFANDILVHNCDGDEAAMMLLLDVLINFSREFLPAHRGGTQDAPLVLNAKIDAGEVDEQILDFELVSEYPLELYRLAEKKKHSSEIKIQTVKDRINKGEDPFSEIRYTHETSNFNNGVLCSSYKKLATMQDKVQHQMELVEKIRATNAGEIAKLVIERHFIRDIRGNLRKFSMQQFRCVGCNKKFRRPPLSGVCTECGGKLIFTISEGGIIKYLEPAISLAEKYNVSAYIKQSLELTKRYIESVFGKDAEQQKNLQNWFK